MAYTVKGLPEVKINHFGMTGMKDAFVDGLESKKKLLKRRSTRKETKLAVGDAV